MNYPLNLLWYSYGTCNTVMVHALYLRYMFHSYGTCVAAMVYVLMLW